MPPGAKVFESENMDKRWYELDILRVLGTFIIVFHHLPDYTLDFYNLNYFGILLKLSYINVLNTYFGLGIFVFVSGFLLYHTYPKIDNVSSFLKKRAVRIFPLYLVALALFTLTLRKLSWSEALIHILGLQILLAPRFVAPMPTLWFIGLIVIFYLFYAFLSKYTRSWLGMVSFSLIVFGLFCIIRCALNIVEYRFFAYTSIFLAGIICCRAKLFYHYDFGIAHVFTAALILCISAFVFRYSRHGPLTGEVTEVLVSQATLAEILMTSISSNVMMLSFIFISFVAAKSIKRCLNRTAIRSLSFVSFSSYCVYLFHRPILDVMAKAFVFLFPDHSYWKLFSLMALGLPLILILSYAAQALNNGIVERLRSLA